MAGIVRGQKSTIGTASVATSQTTVWGTAPQAGSTIVCFVQCEQASSFLTVVDNGTTVSTFTLDASGSVGGKNAFVYRANGITLPGAGSYTVTLSTSSTATTMSVGGIEYIGVQPGGPAATNTGTATGTAVTTNAVNPPGKCLYFGCFSDASGLNPETITYTGAGTQQFVVTNGNTDWPCACADNISSGSLAHTWTLGDSVSWAAAVAAYQPIAPPVNINQAINRASRW